MTEDELVERVARALSEDRGYDWDEYANFRPAFRRMALAAIAVLRPVLRAEALEEAAKVVEAMPRTYDKVKEDHDVLGMKGTWTFTLNNGPTECAAAIRALKEEPTRTAS